MGLKTYSLRLDEEEFESLKKALSAHGDPDLNVGYLIRAYIRDLNRSLPNLKKSMWGLRNVIAFYGSFMGHMDRFIDAELIAGKGKKLRRIEEEKVNIFR